MARFAGIVLAGVVLAGCADDMSDLRAYVDEVKARPTAPIEPIPEVEPFENFRYPDHGIDPFDAALVASALSAQSPNISSITIDPNRPREFLESFPLDTLTMVGTLARAEDLYALVQTREGTIQRVQVGNYMGQNYGEIIEIADTAILLREIVPDGLGGYTERETRVALSDQ
jgi:type IV pilus assembly protein PilP